MLFLEEVEIDHRSEDERNKNLHDSVAPRPVGNPFMTNIKELLLWVVFVVALGDLLHIPFAKRIEEKVHQVKDDKTLHPLSVLEIPFGKIGASLKDIVQDLLIEEISVKEVEIEEDEEKKGCDDCEVNLKVLRRIEIVLP